MCPYLFLPPEQICHWTDHTWLLNCISEVFQFRWSISLGSNLAKKHNYIKILSLFKLLSDGYLQYSDLSFFRFPAANLHPNTWCQCSTWRNSTHWSSPLCIWPGTAAANQPSTPIAVLNRPVHSPTVLYIRFCILYSVHGHVPMKPITLLTKHMSILNVIYYVWSCSHHWCCRSKHWVLRCYFECLLLLI